MTTYLYMLWSRIDNPGQVRFLTDQISSLALKRPTENHVHLKYLYALIFRDRRAVYIGTGNEDRVVSRIPGKPLRYDNDDLARYSQQALDGQYGERRLVITAAYWARKPNRPGYNEEKYEKNRWLSSGWTLLNRNDIYEPVGRIIEVPMPEWSQTWQKDIKAFGAFGYRRYRGCVDLRLEKNRERVRRAQAR